MINKKRNLIVTLANDVYADQARQLFASAYLQAGWSGDYLLLAQDLSDKNINSFKNKGVKIYKTKLLDTDPSLGGYQPIVLSKFYLFKEYFKKWDTIIFLDADIIINGSLQELTNLSGFNAPKAEGFKLRNELISDKQILQKLELTTNHDLKQAAFTTGILVFKTDLIQPDTFNNLFALYQKNKSALQFSEESTLNLFFYKQWQQLPVIYNFNPSYMLWNYNIKPKNNLPIIYHFFCFKKPWEKNNDFHQVWLDNLASFEKINFNSPARQAAAINPEELSQYLDYLKRKRIRAPLFRAGKLLFKIFIASFDRRLGLLGLYLKKTNPKLYQKISLKKSGK